jgi:hypothetical protein
MGWSLKSVRPPKFLLTKFIAHIISGPITLNLGWHYLFRILLAFGCTQLILLIFFCPETQYRRPKIFNIDTSVDTDFENSRKLKHKRPMVTTLSRRIISLLLHAKRFSNAWLFIQEVTPTTMS